jgi:predicted transcriptional regulator
MILPGIFFFRRAWSIVLKLFFMNLLLGAQEMDQDNDRIGLTADIVSAYLSNNAMQADGIPGLIHSVHKALVEAETQAAQPVTPDNEPVVPVKSSIKPDHLVCLACGAKQKTLKRHLNTSHQLTPQAYRDRYNLPPNYPMVAPEYAERRSAMAKKIGLGRKPAA